MNSTYSIDSSEDTNLLLEYNIYLGNPRENFSDIIDDAIDSLTDNHTRKRILPNQE